MLPPFITASLEKESQSAATAKWRDVRVHIGRIVPVLGTHLQRGGGRAYRGSALRCAISPPLDRQYRYYDEDDETAELQEEAIFEELLPYDYQD